MPPSATLEPRVLSSESLDWKSQYQFLKSQIPERFFRPSLPKSLFYFFWDLSLIFGLFALHKHLDSLWFTPLYVFLQGTFFWALFVVGHDCGHGSFSISRRTNDFFGQIAHTLLLVPYHGWRVSHRTHHNFHGNIEKDESWVPLTQAAYEALPKVSHFFRYRLFLLVFPLYLFVGFSGRDGSHFHPKSPLFSPGDRNRILASTTLCFLMLVALATYGVFLGFTALLLDYLLPYTVFVIWLSLVTFLHHTDPKVPWFKGKDWNYVQGAFSTVDRSYGLFESLHHNIGTHTIHHLFPRIPHYYLKEADVYLHRVSTPRRSQSPIFQEFWKSASQCQFLPNKEGVLFFMKSNQPNGEKDL